HLVPERAHRRQLTLSAMSRGLSPDMAVWDVSWGLSPDMTRLDTARSYTAPPMAEVVSTNQFRNGMHIQLDGQTWRIVEFQHVKPGKGGAFVRTKLKSFDSGAVVDKTFRAGEKFERVRTETKDMQYLYDAGDEVVFMDEETYEQMPLPRAT